MLLPRNRRWLYHSHAALAKNVHALVMVNAAADRQVVGYGQQVMVPARRWG